MTLISTTTAYDVPADTQHLACPVDPSRGTGIYKDAEGNWWVVTHMWLIDGSTDLLIDARPLREGADYRDWLRYRVPRLERS